MAYLFYIGKSLTGPDPKKVLELPILGDRLFPFQQCDDCIAGKQSTREYESLFNAHGGWIDVPSCGASNS